MMRLPHLAILLSLAITSAGYAQSPSSFAELRPLTEEYRQSIAPLLESYCLDCHSADSPSGNITLETGDTAEHVLAHFRTWGKMAQTQRLGQMPPAEMEQPTDDERTVLIAWAEKLQTKLEQVEPFDPGPAIFRRLNRQQYSQTVQDLLYLDLDVAAAVGLTDDPRVFGYDSIATALEIPPLLMEKYVAAAEVALAHAVDTKPVTHTFLAADLPVRPLGEMPAEASKDGELPPAIEIAKDDRIFRVNTEIPLTVDVKQAGSYRLRVHGWGYKGPNWITWQPDLAVGVNGTVRKSLLMLGTPEEPQVNETTLQLQPGEQQVSVTFNNAVHGARWQSNDHRFRRLGVERVELIGPVNPLASTVDREAHAQIFFVSPSEQLSEQEAARQIISRFATRAYRRPVETDEVDRLLTLFELSRSRGLNFESSVQPMLKAVMLSPHFLFRIEEQQERPASEPYAISDTELATRLSYFLWGSMPDQQLFQVVREGKLSNSEQLRQQVTRMLDSPRSTHLTEDFATQWLHLEELDHALPSEEFFPEFTAQARASMRREVLMFFEHLIREDRSVIELIDSDYTFGNRHLTKIYRMGSYQHEMQRYEIDKRRHPYRGGLLGMGGVLAMTSHVSRNSPTRRGKWILDVMLGDPPSPPPANVEQIDEGSDLSEAKSFRELLALHASDASCAGCHKKMDPLGFALDNFDPIGRFETERQGQPIDASGTLPGGKQINGPVELKQLFLDNQDQFVRNLTEQMMIYALGRRLEYYDQAAITKIVERVKANDYRMRELILGIVESYPFRHRRNAEEPLLYNRP